MSNEFYNLNAQAFFDSTVEVDMENIYQRFLPHVVPGTLIIDAGCGSGRDSLYFKKNGYIVDAFDASEELTKKASELIQQQVKVSTFDTYLNSVQAHGIWCCASLLHVPKSNLKSSIKNLEMHLVDGGVMYVSFKYGDGERTQNGRAFTDMNEASLQQLLHQLPTLEINELWITGDNRPGRESEKWLNAILKKTR
ncbi:class I SAM-dependent methyltransferase [Psychrosphaera haliotis]|nr:class I SAM-dependent methyltransferase [Psychrosphaera haliotis]